MKTPQTNDSLSKAIAYLGAVEVAPGRYAWHVPIGGTWNVCTADDLLAGFTDAGEIFGVPMPAWWEPNQRFARRCTGGGVAGMRCGAIVSAFMGCGRFKYCAGYYERITADLETGAEVPACD